MPFQLNIAALSNLDAPERAHELDALVQHAREANGSASLYLRGRIRQFELRYEMSSEEMLAALETGQQKETADIAEWLFLLDALEAHGG